MKLDNNCFTTKTGEYVGHALSNNSDHKVRKMTFGGMSLESIGLVRIIEACNLNKNMRTLNIGILTDEGLASLATVLASNNYLEEIQIEETSDP